MPHSWYYPMGPMLEIIDRLQPRSIFEIGVGYGKWGFLTREMLDWNQGRLARDEWHLRIDGAEVFAYDSPLHEWVYDDVRRADATAIVEDISGYDLVLMSDVIEHIPKSEALALLRSLVATNRNILISTPLDFFEQEISDNEHEHHVSHWSVDDFSTFTFDADTAAGAALIVLLAGRGATTPTTRDQKVSTFLLSLPVLGRRSSVTRLLKRVLVRPHRS